VVTTAITTLVTTRRNPKIDLLRLIFLSN